MFGILANVFYYKLKSSIQRCTSICLANLQHICKQSSICSSVHIETHTVS